MIEELSRDEYIRQERERRERQQQQALRRKRIEDAYNWLFNSRSDVILREKTFSNFDASKQPQAYQITRDFLDIMQGTFILHGTYGTGKTHLLAALCNQLIDNGVSARFTTAPKLFAAIQKGINQDGYEQIILRAIGTPLLIIDDIDKAHATEFRQEIYFDILDERVKHNRPTAISTNRLDDLGEIIGGASMSRLKIGQIALKMIGEDYRETLK